MFGMYILNDFLRKLLRLVKSLSAWLRLRGGGGRAGKTAVDRLILLNLQKSWYETIKIAMFLSDCLKQSANLLMLYFIPVQYKLE